MNTGNSELIIREMEITDLDRVVSIDERVFPDEKWGRDSFLQNLKNSYDLCFVIEKETVTGFAILRVSDTADVLLIAVDPDYRRQGMGEKLLLKLLEKAKYPDGEAVPVMLEVRSQNVPAVNLYKKTGFSQIAVRKNYYRNPGDDALIMRRN